MKKLIVSTLCALVMVSGSTSGVLAKVGNTPGEKILFSLNSIPEKDWKKANTLTSVPIDQLGKIKLRIYSGNKTFKEIYGKYLGNLQNGIELVAKFVPKGQTPDFTESQKWSASWITAIKEDSDWFDSNTLEIDLIKMAKGIKLWEIDSNYDIAFAVLFSKEKKTGKTIWVNNGWVDETYWEFVGKPASTGVLKMSLPTKDNTPPEISKVKDIALNYMNTDKTYKEISGSVKFSYTAAGYFSHMLLTNSMRPGINQNQVINFDGSKINSLEIVKPPSFGWNYNESTLEQNVYSFYEFSMDMHASKTEMMFMKQEGDYQCSKGSLTLKKMLNSSDWEISNVFLKDALINCQKK